MVLDNFPVYFRLHGVSLAAIGSLSLLRAPWWAKVFWSPLVDQVGERRQWIAAALAAVAGAPLPGPAPPPAPGGTAPLVAPLPVSPPPAAPDPAGQPHTTQRPCPPAGG